MSTKTSPTSTKYKINFQVGARLEAMDYTLSWWVVLLSCTERFTCFWLVFLVGMFLKTARVTQILFVCMLGWFQPVLKNFRDKSISGGDISKLGRNTPWFSSSYLCHGTYSVWQSAFRGKIEKCRFEVCFNFSADNDVTTSSWNYSEFLSSFVHFFYEIKIDILLAFSFVLL